MDILLLKNVSGVKNHQPIVIAILLISYPMTKEWLNKVMNTVDIVFIVVPPIAHSIPLILSITTSPPNINPILWKGGKKMCERDSQKQMRK